MPINSLNPFYSTKLISLENYLNEMIELYNSKVFPKVLIINGKKGIGKFTLVFHFLNYVYSIEEKEPYNTKENLINVNSNFYNSVLNKTCTDVLFLKAEEGKNIKVEDVRKLKSVLSKKNLSKNLRFTIIDEVEFLNKNSVNALLKTLEEPGKNNYFILINNQQAELIKTISSRCLKNNIYLNLEKRKKIINYLLNSKKISLLISDFENLTPGMLLKYNELFIKYKIDNNFNILIKLDKLFNAYKKDKDKDLMYLSIFLIDHFFYELIKENKDKIDSLINSRLLISNKINDFISYNLNINSVLNFIELKLNNVKQ